VGTTVGESLMLFDGAVTGKLIECDPNKRLVYEWRQTAWCPADVSKCTIEFDEQSAGSTKVTLKQTGIPYKDAHGNDDMPHVVKEGWKRNFFDRIKMVFGFGVPEFS
jgi:activator of HSP90 ATPase